MKKQRLLPLALSLALLAVSCGNSGGITDDSKAADSTQDVQTAADTEFQYEYPKLDCGGEDFNILNTSTTWGFYTALDFDELTGETLDDAIFNRNRFIEDRFNVNLVIEEVDTESMYNHYRNSIMSADDVYDVAYCRANKMSALILENCLWNLNDIDTFRFDNPWWNTDVMDASMIGDYDQLFIASSDISMYGMQGTAVVYFNENMLADLSGTPPYDLVREGKWTLDSLHEYMTLGANLNGDETFTFGVGKSATYGLMSFDDVVIDLLVGAGQNYVKIGDDRLPFFAADSERFFDAAQKIADMLGTPGEFLNLNSSADTGEHYEIAFKNDRTLMIVGQIKSASRFRDMQSSYGILPEPKLDEDQEKYYCYRSGNTPVMSIPITSSDPERAGVIMDAMSYLSWRDVLPVFYGTTLSQKQLRNDDSLEMLEIISQSRYFDVARVYGWSDSLYTSVFNSLNAGNGDISSTVASSKTVVETNIQNTLELLGK